MGQTRSGSKETGKGAARRIWGFPMQTATPWPLLRGGMCPNLPSLYPLCCSGPKARQAPDWAPGLTYSNLVCIQALRREDLVPQKPEPQSRGLPHIWPSVFSPTLSRSPRTGWGAPLWLEGVSPNHYCGGGPWSLGRRTVPTTRCWHTGGN